MPPVVASQFTAAENDGVGAVSRRPKLAAHNRAPFWAGTIRAIAPDENLTCPPFNAPRPEKGGDGAVYGGAVSPEIRPAEKGGARRRSHKDETQAKVDHAA